MTWTKWLADKFELSRGGGAQNVRPMEGLRGFAVFLVFLVHYVTSVRPWIEGHTSLLGLVKAIHTIGNTGVDLFFVLSGYLIYGSLIAREQKFTRFMSRRVERIYPTFIVVFLIYIGLSFVFPHENKIPAPALKGSIYLVQNFLLLPGLFPIEPINKVAWSLSYEMFYYLAIPLLILLLGLRARTPKWRVVFFFALAVFTAFYCIGFGGHVRLIMFISGVLLSEAVNNRRVPTPPSIVSLVLLVIGLLATLVPTSGRPGFTMKIAVLFVSFGTLAMTCIRDPEAWLSRAFSWTPARWLGNMSYSYYLLHGLSIKFYFILLPFVLPVADYGTWPFWVLLPPMFALSLLPPAALFLAVERPFSLTPKRKEKRPAA